MVGNMEKKEKIKFHISMDPEVHEKLMEEAEKQKRSRSNMIEYLVAEALKKDQ